MICICPRIAGPGTRYAVARASLMAFTSMGASAQYASSFSSAKQVSGRTSHRVLRQYESMEYSMARECRLMTVHWGA